MASISVDIDLDEFELEEIFEEIEDRYKSNIYKEEIDEWGKYFFELEPNYNLSLLDQMKIDLLMNNINKITLNDLEKLI